MFYSVFCSLVREIISAKVFVFSYDEGRVAGPPNHPPKVGSSLKSKLLTTYLRYHLFLNALNFLYH